MRIGIVAEGRSDLAVLRNILKGALEIEFEDVQFLRPEYDLDDTDLFELPEEKLGGWGRVKKECETKESIQNFVANLAEPGALVVQIDTSEAHLKGFDVERPNKKNAGYAAALHSLVLDKIKKWLEPAPDIKICHAIAVEEMDAWVLTIYSDDATHGVGDPKSALGKKINKAFGKKEKTALFSQKPFDVYDELTKSFRRSKTLKACAEKNDSLARFVEALGDLSAVEDG